jgi:hypothetical protein
MTAYARRFVLSTAALLIAVFTSGIGASPDFRPFSATLDGFAGPAPTADPCILANTEHGTGNARHMGAITWASNETELTVTAANGDSLHFSYTTLAHLDFTTNQVSASGNWQITSGTGRFQGATGQGVITANGSLLPPFEVIGRMTGVIAY